MLRTIDSPVPDGLGIVQGVARCLHHTELFYDKCYLHFSAKFIYQFERKHLYIIGRFCLFVTKNEHFAKLSQINFYFYFQVGFHGFSWFQVGLSWFQVGFSWFFMVFHGFSWFLWFKVVFSWFFMVFHVFSWFQVDFSWFSTVFHGSRLDFHGFSWFLWFSMVFHGSRLIFHVF